MLLTALTHTLEDDFNNHIELFSLYTNDAVCLDGCNLLNIHSNRRNNTTLIQPTVERMK